MIRTGATSGASGLQTVCKPPGKRPGTPGHWRRLPIVVTGTVEHAPLACAACGAVLQAAPKGRQMSAHNSFELERGGMGLRIMANKHSHFAAVCHCGHETIACPGTRLRSEVEESVRKESSHFQ
jgi:hypothetical protein